MDAKPYAVALIVAFAFGVIEVLTGTFVFLSFGLGCLAVAGVDAAAGGFWLVRDTAVFAVVSCLAVAVLRLRFGHAGDSKRAERDVNDY